MFDSLKDLSSKLAATGYFIDPVMTQVVFLAAKLQKPLLLEGPAGSGKTQLALSVAAAADTHVERLQCYRGVTEDKAIGRFDEGLQRLYMEFSKGQHENWQSVQANLKGRDFFRPGPLMRALECDRPCVLLIDELDKVDEGFEAMLLGNTFRLAALDSRVWHRRSKEHSLSSCSPAMRSAGWATPSGGAASMCASSIRRRSAKRRSSPAALRRPMRSFTGRWRGSRSRSATIPRKAAVGLGDDRLRQRTSVARNRPRNRGAPRRAAAVPGEDREGPRHLLLREGFKSLLDDGARFAQSLTLPGGPTS
jgi:hypothetical protein